MSTKQIYKKLFSDSEFEKYKGTFFGDNWYTTVISDNSDGYYIDTGSPGVKKVLFKFRKSTINQELQKLATKSFLELSKKKHPNRGLASGIPEGQKVSRITTSTGQSESSYVASNIAGYYDRPLREHLKELGTVVACRTTAFTLNNIKLWNNALPFIQKCSKEYSRLGGKYYKLQEKEYSLINKEIKIPNTVFTTITTNYNWRTACHRDSGDYPLGLGNLIVTGSNFNGGYIGFPQFKLLIKIKPGDFLLMDVHQWHANTPIKITRDNGFRLSFVMYLRKDSVKCKNKKTINDYVYFI